MRVYKAIRPNNGWRDRAEKLVIGSAIMLFGVLAGIVLACYLAERYLVEDLINPNDTVALSSFCLSGLVPEPGFCPKSTPGGLKIGQDTFLDGEESDIQPAAGYKVLN